uniref:homeobox protein not2-like n=1 Tax=Styela clava TaxID=7725 RepID=UPI00193AD9F9|nr:homeobox protein not2-like [Styela clava]XP_039266348.1 homeobox protein not2-like [Styela clava]
MKVETSKDVFTQKQLEHLENEFNNQQHMVGIVRRALAKKIRLTDAQVKVWFQNRRIKYRNDNKLQPKEETNKLDTLKRQAIGESYDSSCEMKLKFHRYLSIVCTYLFLKS